jgi:hypothetical protein
MMQIPASYLEAILGTYFRTMRSGYDDNHAVLISASTLGGVDASSNVLHDKDNLDKPGSETFASASILHIDHHHSNLNSAQQ